MVVLGGGEVEPCDEIHLNLRLSSIYYEFTMGYSRIYYEFSTDVGTMDVITCAMPFICASSVFSVE